MRLKRESEIEYEKVDAEADAKPFKGRIFKPRIDVKLCTKCMICIASCPDNCIELGKSGNLSVCYNCCKGCLICLRTCPYGAISEEKE